MRLIIAEKRSVAASIASALGVTSRADGFYEGNNLLVSWCVGHLVSPMDAAGYDPSFRKWHVEDLFCRNPSAMCWLPARRPPLKISVPL